MGGKNKKKTTDHQKEKADVTIASTSSNKVKKSPKPNAVQQKLESIIKSVDLPENADGLTADQLTANQKNALKKVCAKMYGHQHSVKQHLPAHSLESATAQLAAKMKEKLAQQKRNKQLQKHKS